MAIGSRILGKIDAEKSAFVWALALSSCDIWAKYLYSAKAVRVDKLRQ